MVAGNTWTASAFNGTVNETLAQFMDFNGDISV